MNKLDKYWLKGKYEGMCPIGSVVFLADISVLVFDINNLYEDYVIVGDTQSRFARKRRINHDKKGHYFNYWRGTKIYLDEVIKI